MALRLSGLASHPQAHLKYARQATAPPGDISDAVLVMLPGGGFA